MHQVTAEAMEAGDIWPLVIVQSPAGRDDYISFIFEHPFVDTILDLDAPARRSASQVTEISLKFAWATDHFEVLSSHSHALTVWLHLMKRDAENRSATSLK